jgi:hypothetical protein
MNRQITIRRIALIVLVTAIIFCAGGCFTRTVYVPDGKAVRLRQSVKAKVWVLDREGKPVPGEMTLPEGWYCLDAPPEE